MVKLNNSEQIIGTYDNKHYDFDRYDFIKKTPLSTQEISVIVDFKNNELSGDKIAYGEWGNIETAECIDFLKTLTPDEILRDFSHLISG